MESLNYIKIIIFIQVILFSVGAIIAYNIPLNGKLERMLPKSIKAMISFSMLSCALVLFFNASEDTYLYSLFVFIGMLFSSIGDLIMCGIISMKNNLIGGMIFFSMAHINYATAYIGTMLKNGVDIRKFFIIAIGFFASIIFLGYKLVIKEYKKERNTEFFSIIYGAIIINMFLFSLFLAISVGKAWWITFIAAIIFMTSDSIIAITDIAKKPFESSGLWIWITYISAQMGIICSAAF